MNINLSKTILAFLPVLLLTNISLAENNTEHNNETNSITFNESSTSPINLTIF